MENIFTTIQLKNNTEVHGIIDYISNKQLFFFDFSRPLEFKDDFVLLSILWKGNAPQLRFSVYCAMYYPDVTLPMAQLISIKNIESIDAEIEESPKSKQKKRKIRYIRMKTKPAKRKSK